MIPEEMQDLLHEPNHAIIAVNRPAGGAQVTPVWYLWDGEAFYFSTTKDRAKFVNILRDPEISLIVNDSKSARYVAAYGKAQIIDQDDADFESITRKIVLHYLPGEQGEKMLQFALGAGRVVIKLVPEKTVAPSRA